ncbi:uncharacterized protein L969DRAFT_332194 [Mixia osmundae IAM 14324]|uniref:uncharacterized protein n=1 Tax=Mixia osmundae (strain CBS 9802 / IAM 14324 / JCM 22182 / KY 12970) TaxID=764103 RepID=UPI0004A54F04|nr:uncharacterized protein L969DRAFT_332194 [Mixia osmundae IAM 14324]KEI41788.1 hypothetical protein L969DRAFT_332194 [Mixia osmundae IAM 14324]
MSIDDQDRASKAAVHIARTHARMDKITSSLDTTDRCSRRRHCLICITGKQMTLCSSSARDCACKLWSKQKLVTDEMFTRLTPSRPGSPRSANRRVRSFRTVACMRSALIGGSPLVIRCSTDY